MSEPSWSPDGSLTFIGDRDGWWNLWRWVPPAPTESPHASRPAPLVVLDADIGVPQWSLGLSRYAVLPEPSGAIVFARWRDGLDGLASASATGEIVDLDLGVTSVASVRAVGPGRFAVVAGGPTEEAAS